VGGANGAGVCAESSGFKRGSSIRQMHVAIRQVFWHPPPHPNPPPRSGEGTEPGEGTEIKRVDQVRFPALYILSTVRIPNSPNPCRSVRPVSSQSASRLFRSSSVGAFKTGQSLKNAL